MPPLAFTFRARAVPEAEWQSGERAHAGAGVRSPSGDEDLQRQAETELACVARGSSRSALRLCDPQLRGMRDLMAAPFQNDGEIQLERPGLGR